ncbi:hypothetical protein [Ruminococcus albus]|uniref:hypothetical protein n=1 Tax=Ruminococcus albus TaxID=1264 RepID=UPI0018AD45E5|nr:hypothetical protein [Ruminococcus albus]
MEHKTFALHFLAGRTDRPRPKSDSEANPISRPERREGRPDTAVPMIRTKYPKYFN